MATLLAEYRTAKTDAALLQGRHLTKVYATSTGPLVALDDVSFDIREGEFVSLVGPSGCGKSTLLSLLGGLEERSEGTLALNGQHLDRPRADIGFMLQTAVLFPWRTVNENIRLPGTILKSRQTCAGGALRRAARISSASPASVTAIRTSSPAACVSAWRSRGCWPTIRMCC